MDSIGDIKDRVIEEFNSKSNTYGCSDRLQVAIHQIVDDYVTSEDFELVLEWLKGFSLSDFETIDKGLYEGVLEKRGFEMLCRVLLYCLIEQKLYNDDEINKLQSIEVVNGIELL